MLPDGQGLIKQGKGQKMEKEGLGTLCIRSRPKLHARPAFLSKQKDSFTSGGNQLHIAILWWVCSCADSWTGEF